MELENIKDILRNPKKISSNAFPILKEIAALLSSPEKEKNLNGQDLVIRLLERKEELQNYSPLINSLLRQAGLFPYMDEAELTSGADQLAYEYHHMEFGSSGTEVVFHREQAKIFELLMSDVNLIVSAPTSFGKSLIIDSVISSGKFKNIAIVVPTIALIDETRRRLSKKFRNQYKIITHQSQPLSEEKNILVLTQERAVEREDIRKVDFFIIDEFYKLDSRLRDDGRALVLNHAFYKLSKSAKQYYLLGPNIHSVSEDFLEKYHGQMYKTDYATVASDVFKLTLDENESKEENLINMLVGLKTEPTVVFCKSPPSAKALVQKIIESEYANTATDVEGFIGWLEENYHSDWVFTQALKRGIGIHHGKIPRALAQYVVHLFNEKKINLLICTSTLIEGVNTVARNVIIYDKKINTKDLDFFEWSNIKGRAGRMFEHHIGRVFIYDEPPSRDTLHVNVPLANQDGATPCSLLVQMETADLMQVSRSRLSSIYEQDILPISLIKQHSHIEPEVLIATARKIISDPNKYSSRLCWHGEPTNNNLYITCMFIGKYFTPPFKDSVLTGKQLAFKISEFRAARGYDEYIKKLISGVQPDEVSDTIETALDFIRVWLMFNVPKYFMTLDAILGAVMPKVGFRAGEYSYFISKLEHLFMAPEIIALDEYGLPIQIGRKLIDQLSSDGGLDVSIKKLAALQVEKLSVTDFEKGVVKYVQSSI